MAQQMSRRGMLGVLGSLGAAVAATSVGTGRAHASGSVRGQLSATDTLVEQAVTASGMTGGTDCTTALQAFATSAQSHSVPLIIPPATNGQPYKVSAILHAWTGARIIGTGGVLDFQTDHSATGRGLYIGSETGSGGVSNVQVTGLKIISSNASARNGVYGLVSVFDSSDVLIQDCHTGNANAKYGGESTGMFLANTSDFRIVRPRVQNTLADGIQVNRGSIRGVIDHPVVIGAQDDGLALVSVKQDGSGPIYGPCQYIQITQPVVRSSTVLGSGIAFVGAQDCTVVGGSVDGVPACIIYVGQANYGGVINPARNTFTGVVGRNSASKNGAVRIGNADRTVLSGLDLSANVQGIVIVGSSRTKVSGCGVVSNGAAVGVYDDSGSTRTNVSGCVLDGNSDGGILLQGTGSLSTGICQVK